MKKIVIFSIIINTIFLLIFGYFYLTKNNIYENKLETTYKETGYIFLQNEDKSLSIIDIDLEKFLVSFGGVEKNENNFFQKYYADEFLQKMSTEGFNPLQNNEIFAVVNGQFFLDVKNKETGLSFPVKSKGEIITDFMDNEIPKRTLFIDENNNAFIKEGYEEKYLKNKENREVIVAFTPEVRARKEDRIGRSYIGIKGTKNIIFFIGEKYNQEEMNEIIKNYGIKRENILMIDGGPSAQFSTIFENKNYYGGWEVPQFNLIYKK